VRSRPYINAEFFDDYVRTGFFPIEMNYELSSNLPMKMRHFEWTIARAMSRTKLSDFF
jgi:hypothetical protein